MRSYKVEAIVVRRRNFLEKDRLLTLFSKEKGKIVALAKGARRPGSKLSYTSDLGTVAFFYLHMGKSFDYITDTKPIYHPVGARGKFAKTEKLGYLFKVIDKVFEEREAHPKTFHILKEADYGISSANYQLIFLSFLLHTIEDLGLQPELYECSICRKKIMENEKIVFSQREGVAHERCQSENAVTCNPETLKLIRIILQKPFSIVSKAKVNQKVFIRAFKIVTLYMEWHFGKILPEKLL